MMSKFLIYGLIDPQDGQLRYIGKSSSGLKRPREHWKPWSLKQCQNLHKVRWIALLLNQGLIPEVEVLEVAQGAEELSGMEVFWIAYYRMLGCRLTNLSDGGDGASGRRVSPETREIHRLNATGKRASKSTKKKMALARMGHPLTDHHRSRISQGRTGCKNSEPMKDEFRIARSRAHGGRQIIDQNGVIYLGVRDAARRIGVDKRAIQYVLQGVQKQTQGFRLRYVEEDHV